VPCRLDDAEQPENQDQHQDAAKTDIHDTLLLLVLRLKRGAGPHRSSRFAGGKNSDGIILPASKSPDLLDFLRL
jgi:hypothetical protein